MYCDVRQWHHARRRIIVASHPAAHPRERDTEKSGSLPRLGSIRKRLTRWRSRRWARTVKSDVAAGSSRLSISASRNASAINVILKAATASPRNCESFPHLNFDRIGGGRESVCATGHCFDAIFRSELTEGVGTRRALQPSAFSECRKINSR